MIPGSDKAEKCNGFNNYKRFVLLPHYKMVLVTQSNIFICIQNFIYCRSVIFVTLLQGMRRKTIDERNWFPRLWSSSFFSDHKTHRFSLISLLINNVTIYIFRVTYYSLVNTKNKKLSSCDKYLSFVHGNCALKRNKGDIYLL